MKSQAVLAVLLCGVSQSQAFLGTPLAAKQAVARSTALRMQDETQGSLFHEDFENTKGVEVDESGPLRKILLNTSTGCEAEIYTLGACVTSFTVDGYDSLFVRPDAKLDGSKPISGGLPHCFPQFGPGKIQQHGFARNLEWELESSRPGASPSVTLKLTENEETLAMWPHKFQCLYTVTLSSSILCTTLKIKNTGNSAFDFQTALHSYFRTGDVEQTTVKNGAFLFASYLDKTASPPADSTWSTGDITISKPVDYVFSGVSGEVTVEDAAARRKLKIKNLAGYEDTIIWSPFGDDNMGYKNFICVESGKVTPQVLQPGEEWVGKMDLSPSSL
ncbi:carbohydrate binding protein [Tribonema minus]|uniref:glucose-6-phosphate 1-epimerase n=1 Tax=Tribonema minus TaxID=303371 RepID=A0A835YNN9_9STRA|nr:carbohydrate binding protein [Tribonema minus]